MQRALGKKQDRRQHRQTVGRVPFELFEFDQVTSQAEREFFSIAEGPGQGDNTDKQWEECRFNCLNSAQVSSTSAVLQ